VAPAPVRPRISAPLPSTAPASVADSAELLERLASVPGLDVACGLALVRGDTTKYARLLTLFITTHAQDMERVAAGLASFDVATLREVSHTLGGSAGTIGLTRVAAEVKALHSALKESAGREEINTCGTELIAAMTAQIEGIRGVLADFQLASV
jgi:HPt (histidine-containing phosphotransfer) domain-containing protein